MTDGPIPLGAGALVGAAALLLANGALSIWLRLGLERRLAVAALRCAVQLLALGYVLEPVFRARNPALVAGLVALAIGLAGREATGRSSRGYRGMVWDAIFAVGVATGVTAIVGTRVLVGVDPWWEPRYLIPLVGMLLGNSLTGVSLGVDRCLTTLDEGRAQVDGLLALGATRWEAARPVASEAVRTGMIPVVNSMSVVGLVAIPGMMTGQILGGVPPAEAARYQILIMFLIAAATALGVGGSVGLALRASFDSEHRLRPDRIRERPS